MLVSIEKKAKVPAPTRSKTIPIRDTNRGLYLSSRYPVTGLSTAKSIDQGSSTNPEVRAGRPFTDCIYIGTIIVPDIMHQYVIMFSIVVIENVKLLKRSILSSGSLLPSCLLTKKYSSKKPIIKEAIV